MILLVRHARAGHHGSHADDRLRPLDEKGRQQAEVLVGLLADRPLERILTSPFLRCVETVVPLARATGLEPELRDELAEGAPASAARRLIAELGGQEAVLCSHGDVIGELIGQGRPAKKGSVWLLDPADGLEPRGYMVP